MQRSRSLLAAGARVLTLLFVTASWPACAPEGEAPPAATARATIQRIERIVVATGTIEPEREVEVRPRIAGIIERISVESGDVAEKDQVLVEIEKQMLEANVREARAALKSARVEERFARIALDRVNELASRGALSDQEHDTARSRHETALAQVARAEARLELLVVQLRFAAVRAPLTGRILDVNVEEGSAVSPVTAVTGGTLLLSMAATDRLHLKGLVDENEVTRVQVGQLARIRTEAFGERIFEGSVRDIAPVGTRIQNVTYFEVEIEVIDDTGGQLRTRMSGDAEIVAEVIEDALVVPETALRYAGDSIYVETLVDPSTAERVRRDVKIGVVDRDRVQILEGVNDGDVVVLQ